ncbi:hypothetical protein [Ramlibacter sp.]|uniref:hypothetical protein n=1 Tax=Ramlibacter sp. TaxID=1917967 RepID=UPI002BB777B0|nr:hypothetical protein [Ramlibacter sp.]HWI82266.1 hypothetical protein [Ramlibacter sp.]
MDKTEERALSTADFAAAPDQRQRAPDQRADERASQELRAEQAMRPPQHEVRMDGELRPMGDGPVGQAGGPRHEEQLAPLFLPTIAQSFRQQWDDVQIGFVDDPQQAVRRADELVAQVMKNLAETFADERAAIEGEVGQGDTEHLRMALRRYRSFFQRLLSL